MSTRIVEKNFTNNTTNQNKIKNVIREIEKRQGSLSILNIFNTLLAIGSITNTALGIASATFSGAMNITGNFYEKLKDFYQNVHIEMTSNMMNQGGQNGTYIDSVTIKYKFTTSGDKEKLNGIPTVTYHRKRKPGVYQ
ncbi:MAG: hypothetical protein ACLVLG_10905 [Anaerovoracaceae bacterium]